MRVEPIECILAMSASKTSHSVAPRLSVQFVLQRQGDGRFTVDEFPDEIHVNDDLVRRLDPNLIRLERDRLYIHVANGHAVYVPLGDSPLRGCRRYGRLFLRWRDDAA